MTDMLQKLADHTEAAGNYSIEWNPQRSYYESAAEYIRDRSDLYDFETDAMKQRAVTEDSLVVLQWYPNTPIGFNVYAAPDLAALIPWVIKSIDTGRKRAAPDLPVRCTKCDLPKAARRSRIAELGGNPNWCWSGCDGYDVAPVPAELAGDDNASESEEMQNA